MGLFRKKNKAAAAASPVTESPAATGVGPIAVANLQGIGSRAEQQDAFGLSSLADYGEKGLLAVLCDGMGGMEDGRAIALSCVQSILERFPLPADEDALDAFDGEIARISDALYARHGGRGGSTLVLAYLREGRLWFKCMGDSDLFLLRGGAIYALNEHHTYGNELFRRSIPSGADAAACLADPQAGALFRFMGCESALVDANRQPLTLVPGDILLLCSDGVSGTLSRTALLSAMEEGIGRGVEIIEREILAAARPNQDNYTAIVCQYNGAPLKESEGGNHEK